MLRLARRRAVAAASAVRLDHAVHRAARGDAAGHLHPARPARLCAWPQRCSTADDHAPGCCGCSPRIGVGTALALLSKANGILLPLLAWVLEATVLRRRRAHTDAARPAPAPAALGLLVLPSAAGLRLPRQLPAQAWRRPRPSPMDDRPAPAHRAARAAGLPAVAAGAAGAVHRPVQRWLRRLDRAAAAGDDAACAAAGARRWSASASPCAGARRRWRRRCCSSSPGTCSNPPRSRWSCTSSTATTCRRCCCSGRWRVRVRRRPTGSRCAAPRPWRCSRCAR